MITVSQKFKDLMKAPVKVVRARLVFDDGRIVQADDSLVSITIEASGQYFLSAAKTGKAVMLGTDWGLLYGARMTIYMTAYATPESQSGEEICYGVFVVRTQSNDLEKGMTTIEFDDALYRSSDYLYTAGGIEYPTTVEGLANSVCSISALYLLTDMTTLPNYNYTISEDLWATINNTSYRDIIEQIAGATATIARVKGAHNYLEFAPVRQSVCDDLSYANLRSIKLSRNYGKISSVVLARTPEEDNIALVDDEIANLPTGKNLFNPNLLPQTWNGQSSITLNLKPNTTYTFSTTMPKNSSNYADIFFHGVSEAIENETNGVWKDHPITRQSDANGQLKITYRGSYTRDDYHYQLEVGSEATAYEPFKPNGIVEVKLANNEILDDDRETLITPILNACKGIEYREVEMATEGHGWYEVGDRLGIYEDANTKICETVITYIKLEIAGSFKETIKCVMPEETATDYATAGSIYGSIWNTEIKVDKQGNEITSIVSRQDQFENETRDNFTQVIQNIDSVVTTIQTTGGGNILHNSVGYNKEPNGVLVGWDTIGKATSQTSPESVANGALSGNEIDLSASSSITQRVAVDSSGSVYTLSVRCKKSVVGVATIHLRNSLDDYTITLPNGTGYLWEQFSLEAVRPSESYFDFVVETNANTEYFSITDIMLTVGDTTTPWVQASDEILTRNVALDANGVRVSSNTSNDYVKLDELGLNGYSDAGGRLENVFTITRDLTEVSKLKARKQIEMPPLKVLPLDNPSGWAFVKEN